MMNITHYSDYQAAVERFWALMEKEHDYLATLFTRQDLLDKLDALGKRLTDKDFCVLIIGQFVSGKSTFISLVFQLKTQMDMKPNKIFLFIPIGISAISFFLACRYIKPL